MGSSGARYIRETQVDAKGDLLVGTAADTVARLAVGTDGQILIADAARTAGMRWADQEGRVTTGEETFQRYLATSTAAVAPSSGQLRLTFWTARKSETTTQVRMYSGATAAAATPTLCRIGLYLVDANGDGTLVASTANDTSLFAATFTGYTRSWSSSYAKVAGSRYAIGALVVSGTTMPSFHGCPLGNLGSESTSVAPMLGAALSSLADLPASFTAASLSTSGQLAYMVVLP